MQKEVLLLLTEKWADWEAAYAIAEINSSPNYTVKTISSDKQHKVSIGGLKAAVDYSIEEYSDFSNLAMLILPGGFSWKETGSGSELIAAFVTKVRAASIPLAAICGATLFLANNGLLDTVYHTGDSLEYYKESTSAVYKGEKYFRKTQVVVDQGIITANETAAVDFAYEIFSVLALDTPEEIKEWHDYYKTGLYV